jgi:hypothetical protein
VRGKKQVCSENQIMELLFFIIWTYIWIYNELLFFSLDNMLYAGDSKLT